MTDITFDSLGQQLAISAISTYQQHISPRKGYSCAHRLMHDDLSCSEYVKQQLLHQDLATALSFTLQRFRDCRAASQQLSASSGCLILPCCIPI
ncbi:MAG: putative membrane protein insertion efficiency factor [Chroococcopsis gigantea SAG 12.99]|jgi:putative component of membrane protein insertase Oxa1/YidC/SpoIIIJ protein YidD|nr:membrane protein insertion efficiency factor YidD [Chlorogloea purpurea SAG 13.99]MDV2998620.1 putative membrane protein insertion efficiency factor [Chroococcopsis gigantea SAG 12.99]